jgi:hypothetical protein
VCVWRVSAGNVLDLEVPAPSDHPVVPAVNMSTAHTPPRHPTLHRHLGLSRGVSSGSSCGHSLGQGIGCCSDIPATAYICYGSSNRCCAGTRGFIGGLGVGD